MKYLRTVSCILAALAVLPVCSAPAQAQPTQYGPTVMVNSSAVLGNSVSNYATVFTCTKYDQFALDVSFKLNGAGGTTNIDLRIDTSTDNSTWNTVGPGPGFVPQIISIAANGTTTVGINTNIFMNSVGYFRISSVSNGNAQVCTNLLIRAYVKPRRNG